MFRRIEGDARLRGRVKLIGIGAGNSPHEVAFFQQHFNIPFPLFADPDFTLHQRLGAVRTPYFIGIRIVPGGQTRVFYSKLGGAGSGEKLMQDILQASGLIFIDKQGVIRDMLVADINVRPNPEHCATALKKLQQPASP